MHLQLGVSHEASLQPGFQPLEKTFRQLLLFLQMALLKQVE